MRKSWSPNRLISETNLRLVIAELVLVKALNGFCNLLYCLLLWSFCFRSVVDVLNLDQNLVAYTVFLRWERNIGLRLTHVFLLPCNTLFYHCSFGEVWPKIWADCRGPTFQAFDRRSIETGAVGTYSLSEDNWTDCLPGAPLLSIINSAL